MIEAARLCASARLLNAGQSCIGAKRFIIMDSVYETFKTEFLKHMQAVSFGDPKDKNTSLAPMARIDLRNELHEQVVESVEMGASVLCGGFILV